MNRILFQHLLPSYCISELTISENEIKRDFRVAKNLLQTGTNRAEHELASTKHLLENCVKLLDAKTHPELVTSAYYLLSELYLFGTIANEDDTTEAADNSNHSVQEDILINAVSSTNPGAESNVSFLIFPVSWTTNFRLYSFVSPGLHQ